MRRFEDLVAYVATHKEVKRCLVRADLNLPADIEDLSRVHAIKKTIQKLLDMGLTVVLISHYKRPSIDDVGNPKFSLKQVAAKVSNVIGHEVSFCSDSIFECDPKKLSGNLVLMENLRFYEGEAKNEREFAARLACFGDIYVNDAFSVAHRKHASVCEITNFLPSFSGLSLQREVDNLSKLTSTVEGPYTAIVGGSKIASKIEVLRKLSTAADYLIIAGAMGNTFVAARGVNMQESMVEADQFLVAMEVMETAKAQIILPIDVSISRSIKEAGYNCNINKIPPGYSGFDIGQATTDLIIDVVDKSRTILWNGALGAFEFANFDGSTKRISQRIAEQTAKGRLISVIGGGETIASIGSRKEEMTFVSTAGGAFLEFIAEYALPGLIALGYHNSCSS
ncbi:MAG: phosphoglycerate kinase [Holosporales bacterium]|nr:phosphoglycerate kinase [Holosporales bacterium]